MPVLSSASVPELVSGLWGSCYRRHTPPPREDTNKQRRVSVSKPNSLGNNAEVHGHRLPPSACIVNGRLGHEGEAATHAPHGHAARVRGSIHGPHPCTTAVSTASNSAAPAITIDVEERTATTPFAPRRSQPRRRPIVWSRSRRRLRRRLVTPLCGQGPRPAQPAPLGRRLSPPVSHRSRDFHTSCNNAGHRCGG